MLADVHTKADRLVEEFQDTSIYLVGEFWGYPAIHIFAVNPGTEVSSTDCTLSCLFAGTIEAEADIGPAIRCRNDGLR